ncbi:pyruvate, water dikinase regulatory protein [Peribacillus sp. B-H-3]|uniref:pyruvate, water dikinase regulatory protein n=1 Tax=Peribacillus sp. B-H-3 TaxID=3400420 RepID=UPI003B02ACD9
MKGSMIYVVSDSVGETAELVTKAAASQFIAATFTIKRIPYVDDVQNIEDVISLAKMNNAIIAFTLVKPNIREYMINRARKENILYYDILGPLLSILQKKAESMPFNEPGMVRRLDDDYFKRVEAIEFAVKYDDGRDPRGILRADIVLVGVSRTSKTPLSQYLAHKRFKVANVPLVPEVDPPEELFLVPPEKCIGLKISPEKLNFIRRERLKSLGLNDHAIYANMERIKEELIYFDEIMDRLNCPIIDVTNKAVEEMANTIINIIQNRSI